MACKQNEQVEKLLTYKEVLLWASSFLNEHKAEVYAAEWLMKEMNDWTKTDLVMHVNDPMPNGSKQTYEEFIKKIATGIPPQHLVGHEWFYGRRFNVTKDTLIPRPETEELVEAVLRSLSKEPKSILDIGTGTGAIACTLKAERPQDTLTAIDLSKEALEVAKENGNLLNTSVRWLEGNLTDPVKNELFDVIVSNPPYIGEDEIGTLEDSVRDHEPALALFAGTEGLDVYQQLGQELPLISHSQTRIFLEIGFEQGIRVQQMMKESFPTREVTILKDLSGKDRIIKIDSERYLYPQGCG